MPAATKTRRPAPGTRVPSRRPAPRRTRRPVSRFRLGTRTRVILIGLATIAVLLAWGAMSRALAPHGNTSASRFDAIIVLGTPADSEGNPTPALLARVTEAVREYDRGIASHLILSGGPAHNQFAEGEIMARVAEAQGIPPSAVFVEPHALDTIQNACNSARIMRDHGWRSAEVISAPFHLSRAGLIFSHLPQDPTGGWRLDWRVHPAPALEPDSATSSDQATSLEVLKTVRYLIYAQWAERCTL